MNKKCFVFFLNFNINFIFSNKIKVTVFLNNLHGLVYSSMTTNICTVPIRISKNSREIDPAEDERQGIVQNITKQAYWHVSSCKPGVCRRKYFSLEFE